MNIVFWAGILAILVLLWFCLSFAFKWIGRGARRLYNDAKNEIIEVEEHEEVHS